MPRAVSKTAPAVSNKAGFAASKKPASALTKKSASAASKKQKLVAAASELFHKQGIAATTLADVASNANVALGSVFYYFSVKEDLVAAVADHRAGGIERMIARLDAISEPCKRLEGLIQIWVEDRHVDALYGCPVGSFCFELARARGSLSENAIHPFRLLLDWCETQFKLIGGGKKSDMLALHLVSALQGVSMTGAIFGDPELIAKEAKVLRAWLRTIERTDRHKAGKE